MKLRYITFLILITAFLITGCVDESLIDNRDENRLPENGDSQFMVNLRLFPTSDNFTRMEDFEDTNPGTGSYQDGTLNEHAIAKGGNFAIFFDKDERYISCADLYSVNETEVGTEDSEDENGDLIEGSVTQPNPESIYSARFYGYADRDPEYVLVVVNASDKIKKQVTDFPGWTIDETLKQIWTEEGLYNPMTHKYVNDPSNHLGFRHEDGKKYFTMTNSTYVEGLNTSEAKLVCAKKIGSDFVKVENVKNKTKDDIDKEFEEQLKTKPITPVIVFLERMVSKFSLSLASNTSGNFFLPYNVEALDVCEYKDGKCTYTPYKWGVEILGWGVNGYETQNYIFKNVDKEGLYFQVNQYPEWNSPYNKRCWWSEDPHYYKNEAKYPWQFRDAKDKDNDKTDLTLSYFRHYSDETDQFALTYYPFTKFCPEIWDYDSNDFSEAFKNPNVDIEYKGDKQIYYSPENTYHPGIIVDRSRGTRAYELAGTHILICGKLKYDLSGDNVYDAEAENIYRNRVGVSYLDDISMFEDFMNAVNYKLASQKHIFYNYCRWEEVQKEREVDSGEVMRADVGGNYALFYHFNNLDGSGSNEYRELTYNNLVNIKNWKKEGKSGEFKLTIEAETKNGDGKVLPWICFK